MAVKLKQFGEIPKRLKGASALVPRYSRALATNRPQDNLLNASPPCYLAVEQ